jgi:hypothetical protein
MKIKRDKKTGWVISAYGFNVGQNVLTKVDLIDENNNLIRAGTLIRIVAIPAKVRLTNPWKIEKQPKYYDFREYFYNAVLASQKEDYTNRIRANFVTIARESLDKE